MWRRLLHIPFDQRVLPEDIVPGMDLPEFWMSERQGIAVWAIEGLIRLLQNRGRFTPADACERALRQHRQDCNPAEQFFDEMVKESTLEDEWVECTRLYDEYRQFCHERGSRPLENTRFGRIVHRHFGAGSELKGRVRRSNGRRYVYRGLSLLPSESCFEVEPETIGETA